MTRHRAFTRPLRGGLRPLAFGLAFCVVFWLTVVCLALESGWWDGPVFYGVTYGLMALLLLCAFLLRKQP